MNVWKIPKDDIQVIDCSEFCQIMRDYVGFSELCNDDIMQFRIRA